MCVDGYVNWEDCYIYLEIVDGNLFGYPRSKSSEEFYDDYNWQKHFKDHLEYIVRESNEFNDLLKKGGTLFDSYFEPSLINKKGKNYFPILIDTNLNMEVPKVKEIKDNDLEIDDIVNKLYEVYNDDKIILDIKSLDNNGIFELKNLFKYYNVKDMDEFSNRIINSESLLEKVSMLFILTDYLDLDDLYNNLSKHNDIMDIMKILSLLSHMVYLDADNQTEKSNGVKRLLTREVKKYYGR